MKNRLNFINVRVENIIDIEPGDLAFFNIGSPSIITMIVARNENGFIELFEDGATQFTDVDMLRQFLVHNEIRRYEKNS